MIRLRLSLLCLSVVTLTACNPSKPTAVQGDESSLLEDCKEGRQSGAICERAQSAEAHRIHREAGNAFRNMTERR